MTIFNTKPYLLKGKIQNYAWGTKNENAFIPEFLNIEAEKDVPYAELWFGAHPSAPSEILIDNNWHPLDTLINKFPVEMLGKKVFSNFKQLPFLFKVLSAGEALSIQAHPSKKQAEILHAKDPVHYPDDNHKPEIAIALSDLTALAGFKTFTYLVKTLIHYPEISNFIGNEILKAMQGARHLSEEQQKPFVKKMYSTLLKKSLAQKDDLLKAIESLDSRLSKKSQLSETEQKFFELRKIYPGADSGLFSLFLLNMVHLKQSQGLFLKAGLPHAYLKGNIVECMANSDNVVRAGLTPKFQDVETLVDILTYETSLPEIQDGKVYKNVRLYNTPVPEFQIFKINLPENTIGHQQSTNIEILLVTEGIITIQWKNEKEMFKKGQSILIPCNLKNYKIETRKRTSIFKVTVP